MEFLIGRLLTGNLINLDIYNVINQRIKKLRFGILPPWKKVESDAGLGNDGLGPSCRLLYGFNCKFRLRW